MKKNVKVGDEKSVRQIIMAEIPDKTKCPVEAAKLYLSKLPGNNLFPKHKTNWDASHWYCDNAPLGKNSLNEMMKSVSKRAELTKIYTNHQCIRSKVITTLKRKGFNEEACMAVTGHKSNASIARYDKRKALERMTFSEKSEISRALSKGFDINKQITTQQVVCNTLVSQTSNSTTFVDQIPTTSGLCAPVMKVLEKESFSLSAPQTKTMKIIADGEMNKVTITFS